MGSYLLLLKKNQIKSSLHSPYYAETCNELRGPSPRLSAWATQLQRNVATVASRWRHCADLTGPGIEPQTSRTDSVRLATELTAGAFIEPQQYMVDVMLSQGFCLTAQIAKPKASSTRAGFLGV